MDPLAVISGLISFWFIGFVFGVNFGRNKEYKYWVRAYKFVERCDRCNYNLNGCSEPYEIIKEAHLLPPRPPNKR